MEIEPVFTVIISTYNRRDLLPRAVNSVLNQTFTNFELIIIDNGSTDDTPFVAKQFKDSRIRFLTNPAPTMSCDVPRNMGIAMARGHYITFLDDDDIWYPTRLEKVNEAFVLHTHVSAVCHYQNVRTLGKISMTRRYGPYTDNLYERLLYEGNCLSPCAISIKADVFKDIGVFDTRKEFDGVSDFDYWIRMAKTKHTVHFIEEPLGEFNDTGHNLSTTNPYLYIKVANILETHITMYEGRDLYNISEQGILRIFNQHLIALRSFFRRRDYENALRSLFRVLRFLIARPLLYHKVAGKIVKNVFGRP